MALFALHTHDVRGGAFPRPPKVLQGPAAGS